MKQQTFVLFKTPDEDLTYVIDTSNLLQAGELVESTAITSIHPQGLSAEIDGITIKFSGGQVSMSYGCNVHLITNQRTIIIFIAVTVQRMELHPFNRADPASFVDLVDEIQAGNAAIGVGAFAFNGQVSTGSVTWSLIDQDGQILASGNAIRLEVVNSINMNIVRATCVINVPSDVQPSMNREKCQIRYEGTFNVDGETQKQVVAEAVRIIGLTTIPLGVQDSVEMHGRPAVVTLVTKDLYQDVHVEVQMDNKNLGGIFKVTDFEPTFDGYAWSCVIQTADLQPSLLPYLVIWSYSNTPRQVYNESAKLFVVTSSMMDAVNDVLARINKARTTLYGSPDMLFPQATVLLWLRRGADYFNGMGGIFTNFTFTNAKNIIREYWLQCAEMAALESQELAEAEKAFNYSGANISLDVDRTAGYGAAADKIRSRLEQDLKPVKARLVQLGNTKGDGSLDPSKLQPGAMGSVGVTISPASMWSAFYRGYPRI